MYRSFYGYNGWRNSTYEHWGYPYWAYGGYSVNNLTDDYDRERSIDHGGEPFVVNIEEATKRNNTFRTALWTGEYLQVTLMHIGVGEDIGIEIHPDTDQFLRIEDGEGIVQVGRTQERVDFQRRISEDDAIIIPAATWHNVINTGDEPLKLYSIYAPPHHPFGTVHETQAQAMEEEDTGL